jgi:hypothetical protein
MPIDDRLRADLPTALDTLRPDVDVALDAVLRHAARRSRLRRASYAVGLVAAAVAVAVTISLTGDSLRRGTDPVAPPDDVRVLDSGRGTADDPAPLDPGDYAIPFIGAPDDAPWAEVEVPAGWGQDRLLLATGPDRDPHLRRIEMLAVDRVAADPCQGVMEPLEDNVPDIVAALSEQATVQPSRPRPVTLDGHSGQLMRFSVPAGREVEECSQGTGQLRPFGLGAAWTSVFPGWTYRTWVLDVQGDPLVIMAAHGPEATPAEQAELTAIVEGTTFVAPR